MSAAAPVLAKRAWCADSVLPNGSPWASTYSLGSYITSQGKHDAAGRLYERSLDMLEKAKAPSHPRVVETLQQLAGLFGEQVKATPVPLDQYFAAKTVDSLFRARRYRSSQPLGRDFEVCAARSIVQDNQGTLISRCCVLEH